jgi:hypothetical protein
MNLLEEFTKDEQPALTAETLQQWTRELEDLRARMQGQLLQLSIERDALQVLLAKPELTASMAALEMEASAEAPTVTNAAPAVEQNTAVELNSETVANVAAEHAPAADPNTSDSTLAAWGIAATEPHQSVEPNPQPGLAADVAETQPSQHPVDVIYQNAQPAWDLGGAESERQEDVGETPEEADMMRVLQSLRNLSQSQPQDDVKE